MKAFFFHIYRYILFLGAFMPLIREDRTVGSEGIRARRGTDMQETSHRLDPNPVHQLKRA